MNDSRFKNTLNLCSFPIAYVTFALAAIVLLGDFAIADTAWEITVKSDHAATSVPVSVALEGPAPSGTVQLKTADGKVVAMGQFTKPRLLANESTTANLEFVLPEISANEPMVLIAEAIEEKESSYKWSEVDGKQIELLHDEKPVWRYMHEGPDWSSDERLGATYKVYHHVFNPAGDTLLTKGPGGLFPHHRGLFFGFNKISYGDGQKADIWHCKSGETQEHDQVVDSAAGAVLGRHRLAIDWHGQDKKVFAQEEREMTAYRMEGGTLIEFATRLESKVGKISLKGDPQHAGFQFRATQHVPDKTKAQTYYVRPDGKGEPGKFRNWPNEKEHVNLDWNALSIVVDDQRYTVCYLDRPENPKESRFSERDYGRFGSYFEFDIEEDQPLELNYRIWVQNGEMSVEQIAAHSANFVDPPVATAKVLEAAKSE